MKPLLLFSLLLPAFALAGDGGVKWDFDPDGSFANLKTFSFLQMPDAQKTGLLADPKLRDQLRNLIADGLQSRGMSEVPRDQPHDLAVRFWVGVRSRTEYTSIPNTDPWIGWGGYPPYFGGYWGYWYDEVVVTKYHEGILLVDLINPNTRLLLWRVYLTQRISGNGSGWVNAQKNIKKGFLNLPPNAEQVDKQKKRASKLGVY
jgi:hypothetical protein